MKNTSKTIGLAAVLLATALFNGMKAQQKDVVDKTGDAIKTGAKAVGKTAKKVGNKTAEVAVKGTAEITDKKYENKVAPDGSQVYIDKEDNKYYVNDKGRKIYLKESEISDKVEE